LSPRSSFPEKKKKNTNFSLDKREVGGYNNKAEFQQEENMAA